MRWDWVFGAMVTNPGTCLVRWTGRVRWERGDKKLTPLLITLLFVLLLSSFRVYKIPILSAIWSLF